MSTNAQKIIESHETFEDLREYFHQHFFEMLQWEIPETGGRSDDYKEAIRNVEKVLDQAAKHGFKISGGIPYAESDCSALPKINIRCECSDGVVHGSTYLNVVRVEQEDDGSFTAVTDHWPNAEVSR